jgi:cytidine deaminase
MDRDRLLERARAVRDLAYAPYSAFRVGAALLTESGSVFVACNVENASYGLTICAERAAVFAAVAAGQKRFSAVAVATDGPEPVWPCGACRQVLAEFAPAIRVFSEGGGVKAERSLDRLLPDPFAGRPAKP